VNLINFTPLHNAVRNVSLHLPEGYELIVGTRTENINLYYNFIIVTVLGNIHCIKIIILILFKT